MKLPFGRNKMQKFESVITTLAKRGEQLAAKRIAAQETLNNAVAARQQALLSGDLDDQRAIDKLQGAVDSATSALAGLDDALAILVAQKLEAEAQLTAERERAERKAAADKLGSDLATIETQFPAWLSATRELSRALGALSHVSHESGSVSHYLANCAGETEIATAMIIGDLRQTITAIVEGNTPIPVKPVEPVEMVPVERPKLIPVFAVKNLRWNDGGHTRCHPAFHEIELPEHLAERALRRHLAVPIPSEIWKAQVGKRPFVMPVARKCASLDDEEADAEIERAPSPEPAPITFEPLPNVAKPFTLRVARGNP